MTLGTVLIVFGGIAAALCIKCVGGLNIEFSEGSRSGVIQKLSKKGMIWKTWEGELNLGYTEASTDSNGHQNIRPAIFHFSVSSDWMAEKLKEAEIDGKRVTLDYKQYFLRGWDKGGTSYDVHGVTARDELKTVEK
jgi:hypothetical protein